MSLFDIFISLFLFTFLFGLLANSNKPKKLQRNNRLAKLVVKYTDEFIFLKRNYAYEIHSLEDWCDFLESSDYARNEYVYFYDKLLDHVVAENREDLKLMTEDKKRFFNEHNDGSKRTLELRRRRHDVCTWEEPYF